MMKKRYYIEASDKVRILLVAGTCNGCMVVVFALSFEDMGEVP
jgi:hypothetical protein